MWNRGKVLPTSAPNNEQGESAVPPQLLHLLQMVLSLSLQRQHTDDIVRSPGMPHSSYRIQGTSGDDSAGLDRSPISGVKVKRQQRPWRPQSFIHIQPSLPWPKLQHLPCAFVWRLSRPCLLALCVSVLPLPIPFCHSTSSGSLASLTSSPRSLLRASTRRSTTPLSFLRAGLVPFSPSAFEDLTFHRTHLAIYESSRTASTTN